MQKYLLNIGIICGISIIGVQCFAVLYELFGLELSSLTTAIDLFNYSCHIIILVMLYKIVVVEKEQFKLRTALTSLIATLVLITIFSTMAYFKVEYKISALLLIFFSFINLIFYFILISKLNSIDNSELKYAGQLHNYGLAFIVVFLLQLLLSVFMEFYRQYDLKFISHIIHPIPIIFIVLFFKLTQNDIKKNQKPVPNKELS